MLNLSRKTKWVSYKIRDFILFITYREIYLETMLSGKKTTVGHFVIGPDVGGPYGEQWKQALAKPGQQIMKWQAFE